jgi:hypothetical protein
MLILGMAKKYAAMVMSSVSAWKSCISFGGPSMHARGSCHADIRQATMNSHNLDDAAQGAR